MSTAAQDRLLAFIRDRIEQVGSSPTYDEMCAEFGNARGVIRRRIEALIVQGLLSRTCAGRRNLVLAGSVDLRPVTTAALRAELARRGVTMDALSQPRPMTGGRPCAANGCEVHVGRGKLMCWDHWQRVRPDTRKAIIAAFSAGHAQAYQEAVEAARDQVSGFHRVVERAE